MKRTALYFCVATLLVGAVAFGQGITGAVMVTVTDEDGGVLPGVTVSVSSPETLGTRNSVTDGNGVARIPGLPPGNDYTVTSSLSGFNTMRNDNVIVNSGSTASLLVSLPVAAIEAEIVVTAESPLVDFTSAMTGADLDLELMESLPTGRSYQTYLQLVPGVMPADPTVEAVNPASRSGVNYSDIGGDIGRSSDNFYYIEGIDVTDPQNGFAGADLNTEIIQEQQVVTGGIPAEFVGSPGLVSSVVTKSGGNDFHGSVNYFFQNDSLMSDNEHVESSAFTAYDAAFTLGGPILRDKLWFFGSYRLVNREQDVSAVDTGDYMRTVTSDAKQGYFKASWAPSSPIKITGTYLTDPRTTDGQVLQNVTNNRDRTEDTGGDRYILNYSQVFGPAFLSVSGGVHSGELSRYAASQEIFNDNYFNSLDSDDYTNEDQQLGGYGNNLLDQRDNNFADVSFEWYLGSSWGDHTLSIGYEYMDHERLEDLTYPGDVRYSSYDDRYSGVTAFELQQGDWTGSQWAYNNTSDYTGLITAINASPNRDAHYATMDVNNDGTISELEMGNGMVFDNTGGNPNDNLNYYRINMRIAAPQTFNVKGQTAYLQDSWQLKRFTANVGARYEQWKHYASDGSAISDFDSTISPRIGLVYDLTGKGKMKISGFYGRYYDPIRMNMTDFAGSLIGSVRDEQVWTNFEWLTYRTRGGVQTQDALFSPTTKTPYTDDLQLGFEMDLGGNMSFEALAIRRETRDIMEDYDLCLYAYCTDGTTSYQNPTAEDSLWLGLDYFGYDENPGSNFVIGTLYGGERNWDGIELVFRKRYANNWQGLASYTYADATGSSNSDSNADFQGDTIELDPRAPFQFGRQPGMIEHMFKAAGSYNFNFGLQLGGGLNYSSGTAASRTYRAYRRNLPMQVDTPYTYGGMLYNWLAEDSVGSLTNDSWFTLDLRVKYTATFGWLVTEFFLDIFNVADDQAATRNQDVVAGADGTDFGDPIQWNSPRRTYLGVRLSF